MMWAGNKTKKKAVRPTTSKATLSSTEKGRHAELLAITALLANGYTVLEPIAPEPFDLAFRKPGDKRTYYAQVKTVFKRDETRYGGEWLIVRGTKNNGKIYTRDEADYFIAVWQGDVYIFPNSELTEYWSRPSEIGEKWTKLKGAI